MPDYELHVYYNVIMEEIVGIHRFAVDGADAERVYEIFRKSYFIENKGAMQPLNGYSVQVDLCFADGVFRVEERTTAEISYIAEIIYFFADRDHIFSMSEYYSDGVVQSYSVEDYEGKYFVRPPKTEWELQMEQVRNSRSDDDLPF